MDRVLVLLAVLVATAALAAWWRSRDGRVVDLGTRRAVPTGDAVGDGTGDAADLVAAIGPTTPLTLVEFTAPDCAPCARTRALLDEVAATRPDVAVVAVDVGAELDLARAHRIMRAPTTLLVDDTGQLLGRVAGVPRREDLLALVEASRRGSVDVVGQ